VVENGCSNVLNKRIEPGASDEVERLGDAIADPLQGDHVAAHATEGTAAASTSARRTHNSNRMVSISLTGL
jgi:hypothetical protein